MAIQFGLGSCRSDPFESGAEWKFVERAEMSGQFVSLVALTPLLSSPMQGDGDDEGVFVEGPEAFFA